MFYFFFYEIFLICKYLISNKIDVVETSSGAYQIKAAIACIFTKTKFIIHLNDSYCPFIFKFVLLISSYFSLGVCCASDRTLNYYKKYISKPSVVIQAPINIHFFKKQKQRDSKFYIGTLCNISPVKDLKLFLKIANEFQKNKSNKFKFVIFGKVFTNQKKYFKYLKDEITRLNLKNVQFITNKKNTKNFLKKLKYYICTSKNESSPLAVWEALSYGVPVFSTDVGDLNKLLRFRKFKFVYNIRNEKIFFKNIMKFDYLDKREKKTIIKKLTIIAKKNFHPKVCCSKHLKFIYKHLYN